MKRLRTWTISLVGLFAALMVLAGPALAASATSGTVKGQVVDDGGLSIPGALLTLSSPNLIGGAVQTTSDGDGAFIFAELPPGTYKLLAQKQGFGQVTKTAIPVQIGRTTNVTVEMEYGGEVVIVEETRKTIDTESASQGDTLSADYLSRIPTGRSYQDAVQNAAGVTGGANPNSGGASSNENTFLLDGINVTDPVTGTFSMNFNYDAIEEIQVITGAFDPEYGESLGAVISVVTKSGGNTLEVIAAGYYLNGNWGPKMDARFAADGYPLAPTGFDETAQTGEVTVLISGPVVKDRVWFLGSYQYTRTLYSNVGIALPRDFDGHYFFGKLTMQPTSAHRFTLQFNTDPTTIDNLDQYDIYTNPDAQNRQTQGGYLASLKWNWFINPEANLDTNLSYQKTFIQGSAVPCTHIKSLGYNACEPGEAENTIDYETPGRIGLYGAYDRDNYYSFDFDDRFTIDLYTKLSVLQVDFLGKHDFKAGVELKYLIWDRVVGFNGNLIFYDLNEQSFDPNTLSNFYWVEYSGAYQYRATGTHFGAFIQDVYKPVENLTVRYGVRYDRAAIRNDANVPVIDVGLFGPRFYAIWDPFNNEKTKVYGGYGRFNDTGRLSVAYYLSASDLGAKLVVGEYFGNSYNNSAAPGVYQESPPENTITVFDNTTAPHSDEFTIGAQREVVTDLAAGVKFEGKFTRDVYAFDEINYIYDENGYSAIGTTTGQLVSLYRLRTPAIALRDYYQTDFTLTRLFNDRWLFDAKYSYVVSRGRSQGSLSAALANPSQVELLYGNLGTDIRHQVKLAAAWDLPDDPWTTKVGLQGYYFSGSPFSRYYYSPGGPAGGAYEQLKEQVGTYGRTNGIWQISLLVQQAIPTKKGKLNGTVQIDNVTNNQFATVYYSSYISTQNRYLIAFRQDPINLQLGVKYEF